MASLVQLSILCSSSPAIRSFFAHHKPVSVRSLFRGTTVFADKTLLKSKTPQVIIKSSRAHLHEKSTSANTITNPVVVHFRVQRLLLPPPPPPYSLSSAPTPRRLIPNAVYLAPVPQQVAAARKGRATAVWVGALPPAGVLVEAGADARKGVRSRRRRRRVGGLGLGGVDEGGMERNWWWVEAGVGAGGSSGSSSSSSDSTRYTRCGIAFFAIAQHVSEKLGVVGRACQIEVDKGIPWGRIRPKRVEEIVRTEGGGGKVPVDARFVILNSRIPGFWLAPVSASRRQGEKGNHEPAMVVQSGSIQAADDVWGTGSASDRLFKRKEKDNEPA